MTTLKYKDPADGLWKLIPIVGPPGAGVPVGGATGDVLIKQSATDRDTRWGINPPRLKLEATAVPTLASDDAPLTLGTVAAENIVGYKTGFYARNNGALATLRLNYYGGLVAIGGGDTAQYPLALMLSDSAHASSRRAAMMVGSAWTMGQDFGGNGSKDFFLYSEAAGQRVFTVYANADQVNVGDNASVVRVAKGSGGRLQIGDDAEIVDCNLAHSLCLRSLTDSNWGKLRLGNTNCYMESNSSYLLMHSNGAAYIDGNQVYFRNVAGADIGRYDGSNWIFNAGSLYSDGSVYAGSNAWFRVRGSTGIHWDDYGGGWHMQNTAQVRCYNNKEIFTGAKIESSRVAGGSYVDQCFFANPGNTMAGYGWHPGGVAGSIRMQVNNGKYHMNNVDAGWYYNSIGAAWEVASSERGKQDLVPLLDVLPTMPALPVATMVRALRPLWWRTREDFAMKEVPPTPEGEDPSMFRPDPATFPNHVCRDEGPLNCGHTPDDPCGWKVNWLRGQLGFVAEEVEQVLPQLVRLDLDMKPASLDLGSLVGLAYAMLQELDTRLTTLEAVSC